MKTPIFDFVKKYAEGDNVRFHMPGHKGREFLGCEPYDVTEIIGADTLYSASGIIEESENNATRLFDTAHTFYSAEGSTLAIKAMLALATKGKKPLVLAARNAHKAFVYAAALLDLEVAWLYPECFDHLCSAKISENEVERALSHGEKPSAVYITTPDYLGGIADVEGIARVCHAHGIPLLVDNAHGAYLRFLTPSIHPITLGADMCCDSAHKTLPVLTGGAYLHISKSASEEYVRCAEDMLSVFASTSPSYLILQSLDLCNKYLSCNYSEKLLKAVRKIEEVKKALRNMGHCVLDTEPLKITLNVAKYGYTGYEIANVLHKNGIEPEFFDGELVVLMATPENDDNDFNRLISVLHTVLQKEPLTTELICPSLLSAERCISIREAVFAPAETVSADAAAGRISAAPTVSCPPAIPIVVSGEKITEDAIRLFKKYGIDKISVVKR